jgi:DNA-binding NtrC family response regulator
MQAKLLRVLQEKCFFRLGAERTTHSDFRVISATNRDLYADMLAGTFREDLFYRLAVIRIELAPLRERPEDIRWLTEMILQQITAEQGIPIAMSELFLRDLMARNWRGNIRELRAYLEQAVVMSEGGVLNTPVSSSQGATSAFVSPELGRDSLLPLHSVVEQTERKHIQHVLQHTQGNVGQTAAVLGISRKTLWDKMKKLGLSRDLAA